MHCEQTDILPDICRYLISPTPTPSPSYIFRKLVISRMSSITFEFSDCLPIIFVLGVKTRILLDSKIQKNPKEFNGSASLLASAFFVHLYERCEKFLIRRIRRKLTGYSFHIGNLLIKNFCNIVLPCRDRVSISCWALSRLDLRKTKIFLCLIHLREMQV